MHPYCHTVWYNAPSLINKDLLIWKYNNLIDASLLHFQFIHWRISFLKKKHRMELVHIKVNWQMPILILYFQKERKKVFFYHALSLSMIFVFSVSRPFSILSPFRTKTQEKKVVAWCKEDHKWWELKELILVSILSPWCFMFKI